MALRKCKECGKEVSTKARSCVGCGAPTNRKSSSLGDIIALAIIGVICFGVIVPAVQRGTGGPHRAHASDSQSSYSPSTDSAYPFKLVTMLSNRTMFGGIRCGLQDDGKGWHRSNFDGIWNATLRRSFGPNEVSCLLESGIASTVQRIELEAEFYEPGYQESAMLLQFVQSAQILMHPTTPPVEFAEAVTSMGEWSNDEWELARIPYANGGFGLMLRNVEQ